MDDDTRKIVLKAWQERKQEKMIHPYLNEKMSWGLVSYSQALLLARYIRGDLDEYLHFCGSRLILLILITYDVSTLDREGRKRLEKVVKRCVDHGQRV